MHTHILYKYIAISIYIPLQPNIGHEYCCHFLSCNPQSTSMKNYSYQSKLGYAGPAFASLVCPSCTNIIKLAPFRPLTSSVHVY